MVPKAGNICDTIFQNTNTQRLIWLPALLIFLLYSMDISSIRRLVWLHHAGPGLLHLSFRSCRWGSIRRSGVHCDQVPPNAQLWPWKTHSRLSVPGLQDHLLADAQLCPPPERAQSSRQSRATSNVHSSNSVWPLNNDPMWILAWSMMKLRQTLGQGMPSCGWREEAHGLFSLHFLCVISSSPSPIQP